MRALPRTNPPHALFYHPSPPPLAPQQRAERQQELAELSPQDRRFREADFSDDATLTMPPGELQALMRPATADGAEGPHRLLRAGEAVVMVGPVVHAAPPVRAGVWRPVLFVNGYLPGHPDFAAVGLEADGCALTLRRALVQCMHLMRGVCMLSGSLRLSAPASHSQSSFAHSPSRPRTAAPPAPTP